MAITQDTILAGMRPVGRLDKANFTGEAAGQLHSLFAVAGPPGQGSVGSPGMAGLALSAPLAGCFQITNPSAPVQQYLAGLDFQAAANICGIMVCDRLWHNSGIAVTTTTAQTINSVAWPARDDNGTVNGAGVTVGIEVVTATTNASAITNTTLSYTNSADQSGRTATIPSFPATAAANTFVPFVLAGNDQGIKSIQTVTLGTSYAGGAISLVACRTLFMGGGPVGTGQLAVVYDFAGTRLPRVYDSSCVWPVVLLSGTAAGRSWGGVSLTHVNPS